MSSPITATAAEKRLFDTLSLIEIHLRLDERRAAAQRIEDYARIEGDSKSAALSRLRERVKELEALCETSYQFHLNKLTTQEQRQLGIWLAEQHLRAATQPQP